MTTPQENGKKTQKPKLLNQQEQAICKKIATRTVPHSQRAMALLLLNEGSGQAMAAELAGLSVGQLRYWLNKFRDQGVGIFPDELLEDLKMETEPDVSEGVENDLEVKKEEKKPANTKKSEPMKVKKEDKKAKEDKKVKKDKKKDKKAKADKKAKKNKKAKKGKKK